MNILVFKSYLVKPVWSFGITSFTKVQILYLIQKVSVLKYDLWYIT